jgi:group I intron endonuclease
MILYKITNLITGERYIGQTKNSLKTRFTQHIHNKSKTSKIANAIKFYGKDNFKIQIISRCDNIQQASIRERYYIKVFKTRHPHGYNLTDGGESGKTHSEETLKLISKRLKETMPFVTKRTTKGMKVHTESSKKRISNFLKGHTWNRGKKRTEEFKKRRSEIATLQNQKKVINTTTGQVLDTAKLLVDILNIPYSTIINRLNGHAKKKLDDWEYLT